MLITKAKRLNTHDRTTVHIPISMAADIDDYARSIGRSRSAIVRWAVREYLTRNKRPELAQADSDD